MKSGMLAMALASLLMCSGMGFLIGNSINLQPCGLSDIVGVQSSCEIEKDKLQTYSEIKGTIIGALIGLLLAVLFLQVGQGR